MDNVLTEEVKTCATCPLMVIVALPTTDHVKGQDKYVCAHPSQIPVKDIPLNLVRGGGDDFGAGIPPSTPEWCPLLTMPVLVKRATL